MVLRRLGDHTLAKAGIGSKRVVPPELDRLVGRVVDRHDLVVLAVDEQVRDGQRLFRPGRTALLPGLMLPAWSRD
jgi:hypothetical protein